MSHRPAIITLLMILSPPYSPLYNSIDKGKNQFRGLLSSADCITQRHVINHLRQRGYQYPHQQMRFHSLLSTFYGHKSLVTNQPADDDNWRTRHWPRPPVYCLRYDYKANKFYDPLEIIPLLSISTIPSPEGQEKPNVTFNTTVNCVHCPYHIWLEWKLVAVQLQVAIIGVINANSNIKMYNHFFRFTRRGGDLCFFCALNGRTGRRLKGHSSANLIILVLNFYCILLHAPEEATKHYSIVSIYSPKFITFPMITLGNIWRPGGSQALIIISWVVQCLLNLLPNAHHLQETVYKIYGWTLHPIGTQLSEGGLQLARCNWESESDCNQIEYFIRCLSVSKLSDQTLTHCWNLAKGHVLLLQRLCLFFFMFYENTHMPRLRGSDG